MPYDLDDLAAFAIVARTGGFRDAAREMGRSPSGLSDAVRRLETAMGVRLLNRTTRSVSLTDAGAMLHAHLSPAFGDIAAALDTLNQFRDTPFGKVRLNVPNSLAPFVLGPVMGPLLRDNPNLQLEIVATDRLVDIVDGGFRGRLTVNGGGWSGALDFAPVGEVQRIAAQLQARNARIGGVASVRVAQLQFTALLDPAGTKLDATARGAGLRHGALSVSRFDGTVALAGESGEIRAAIA